MALPVTYTFASASTTYICALQTTSGATALLINGTGVDAMSTYLMNSPRMTLTGSGFQRTVSLTSTGNLGGINFTIVGKDIRGNALSETIAGPSNNTVYTTGFFYEVNSITPNATVGTAVSAGIGTTGNSQWYRMDYLVAPTNVGLGVTVSGTDLTWTVVQTTAAILTAEPPANSIINSADTNLVSQTTSRQGNYTFPFRAFRCNISASTAGNLTLNAFQGSN